MSSTKPEDERTVIKRTEETPGAKETPPGEEKPGFGGEKKRSELGDPPRKPSPAREQEREEIEEHNANVEKRRED